MDTFKDLIIGFLELTKDFDETYEKLYTKFKNLTFTEKFEKYLYDKMNLSEDVKTFFLFKTTDMETRWDTLSEETQSALQDKLTALMMCKLQKTLIGSESPDFLTKENFNVEKMLDYVTKNLNIPKHYITDLLKSVLDSSEDLYIKVVFEKIKDLLTGEQTEESQEVKRTTLAYFERLCEEFKEPIEEIEKIFKDNKNDMMGSIKHIQKIFSEKKLKKIFERLLKDSEELFSILGVDVNKVISEVPLLVNHFKKHFANNPILGGVINNVLRAMGIKQQPKVVDKAKKDRRRREKYRKEFREKSKRDKKKRK